MAARPPQATATPAWDTYKQSPSLVLGFHGCDRDAAEAVLNGSAKHLKLSDNEYDWLGPGIYFWESDPWRALEFAQEAQLHPQLADGEIKTPYVIGAVLHLGRCCNLLDAESLGELERAYEFISNIYQLANQPMPENRDGADLSARFRDRLVVETMHELRRDSGIEPYDSVRAAFLEGDALYPGAGFKRKNHIQIAVRSVHCIKGYFRLPGL